jgi:membrane-associated phospholipid phosphatase
LGFGANESLTSERIWVVKSLVTILSVIFLIAWALFLRGNRWVLPKFLGKKVLYVLAVPWSMGILNWGVYTGDGDSSARDRIFSSKVYSMWLWPWAVLAVLCLKKWSKRLRPCLKCTRDFIKEKKSFPAIPIMLSNTQGDESFPSGDATTAAAFAIPLAYIESSTHFVLFGWSISSTVLAAYAIVFVTCSGRVYFLAHHVCDVVAGTAISFAIHLVSTCMGLGVYDMKWWYPLAANAVVTAHAKWKMERILNLESKKLKA